TTSPNVTNSQSDVAGVQTIQAADIILSTSPVPTSTFTPGSNNNVVYIAQMTVATQPVVVNNIQFAFTGTHDVNDLETVLVYFNAASPVFAGSTFIGSAVATFAAPHTYNINISRPMPMGSTGYFIIVVNVSPTGTIGNTVVINGATDPVIFGFTTMPNITNSQMDNGGLHTLPVNFLNVTASNKSAGVQIDWTVNAELNIGKYIVERSADGRSFSQVGETNANIGGASTFSYNLFDPRPSPGNNFYRVRAISKDGRVQYSPIVKININNGKTGISIYPNPVVKNGLLNLNLQNLKKDHYSITIFNNQGQQVLRKTIQHAGGNSVQTVNLPVMAAGVYTLEVKNEEIKFIKAFKAN
ncbi:MAG: T9SS type A sorting domain-containing protein, partial [Ferruginibacter sp.]